MQRKQIHYFLPMARKVTKKSGRTVRSLLPLFTGYIFFCGTEDQRLQVLQTNRVANIIGVSDPEGLVEDLVPIQTVLQQGQPIQPHNYIKAGQKCRVLAGPLMGTEGIIEKGGDTTRLVLQIDMLGQATSVEIAFDMIEIIDD
jgi:transcriptional antiterminator RfaH